MPKSMKIVLLLAVLAAAAYVVVSSRGLNKVRCEVCITFNGQESCRAARAETRDEAIAAARDNACAGLTNGRAENIRCGNTPPQVMGCSDQ